MSLENNENPNDQPYQPELFTNFDSVRKSVEENPLPAEDSPDSPEVSADPANPEGVSDLNETGDQHTDKETNQTPTDDEIIITIEEDDSGST